MEGLIGRLSRHPETQFISGFETRAHAKTHTTTGTNSVPVQLYQRRQCHGGMQSELWRVPLSPNTLSLSSRDVCAALLPRRPATSRRR